MPSVHTARKKCKTQLPSHVGLQECWRAAATLSAVTRLGRFLVMERRPFLNIREKAEKLGFSVHPHNVKITALIGSILGAK